MTNPTTPAELAINVIVSYLYMLEFCLDNRDASFNVLDRMVQMLGTGSTHTRARTHMDSHSFITCTDTCKTHIM